MQALGPRILHGIGDEGGGPSLKQALGFRDERPPRKAPGSIIPSDPTVFEVRRYKGRSFSILKCENRFLDS
jgi:hypothetical protein